MSNHFHRGKGNKGEKKYLVTPVKPKSNAEIVAIGETYNTALKEVLRSRDVLRFRNFLQADKRALPEDMLADTFKLETMLYQLILNQPDLVDLHAEARTWLDGNTVKLDGRTLLQAAGITPEQKREEFEAQEDPSKSRRTIFLNVPPPKSEPLDRHHDN